MTRHPSTHRIGLAPALLIGVLAGPLAACDAPAEPAAPAPAKSEAPPAKTEAAPAKTEAAPAKTAANKAATPEPPPAAQTSSRIASPPDPPPASTAPLPTMPHLRERPNAFMEALLSGTLREQDGCLRVGAGDKDPGHLVIWLPEYTLHRAGERLEIQDAAGKPVARVGDPIRMGGGEMSLNDSLKKQLAAPIPTACKGPYWVMGQLQRS